VKKLLVVALSVVMVLAFAAFASAATTSFVGVVNAEYNTLDAINNNYGDVWAEFDMAKDFTEGWTGGLKFRVKPKDTNTGFEGDGFIKYSADMWNVNFATGGGFSVGQDLNPANATKVIGGITVYEGSIVGGPSVTANVIPMEGLTATLFLNDEGLVTEQTFNIGLKAVYDLSPLKVGFGYLTETAGTESDDDGVTSMGVFGSYKLMEDALTVGAEYQSRTYPEVLVADPQVGMKVYANYAKDALSAGISYTTRTVGFCTKDDKAAELSSLADRFMDIDPGWNDAITGTETHSLISLSASYKMTDAITVGLNVDTTDTSFTGIDAAGELVEDANMGYKLYVTDQIVPDLKLEAGYQSFIQSKVYVTLSATL